MKKFISDMLVGTATAVAALAGVATVIRKIVIDPVEGKEDIVEENCKKAMRKRIAR